MASVMKVPRPGVCLAGRHAASCHGTERFLRCFRENDGHSWVSFFLFFFLGVHESQLGLIFCEDDFRRFTDLYIRLFKVFTIQRCQSLDANLNLAVASARRWPRL